VALALPPLCLIVLVTALLFAGWDDEAESASFGATLLGQSPIMIGLAATVTVGLYILPEDQYEWFQGRGDLAALLVGVGVALAFGFGVAFFKRDFTAPNNINPQVYGALQSEYYSLNARQNSYCSLPSSRAAGVVTHEADAPTSDAVHHAACAVACRNRDFSARELGLSKEDESQKQLNAAGPQEQPKPMTGARWVLGTGYIDIWHSLHAMDEALFLVKPDSEVAGDGMYDVMRLKDSNINNSVDHIDRLRRAIALFDAEDYLTSPPPVPEIKGEERTPAKKAQARVVMQQVRHVINQYRDDRREGLVRTRNDLLLTGTLTGVIGLLLLALVVLRGVEDSTVVAAFTFYLVGATVGSFNQLSGGWRNAGATEEDYGLSRDRLLYTPMLSGLAAVGGVVITTMLYASLSGPIVTTQEVNGSQPLSPPSINLTVPQLSDIFDLDEGRFGIVIAAVFGLTPSLLIDRLKSEAERYKADLQSSNAEGNK